MRNSAIIVAALSAPPSVTLYLGAAELYPLTHVVSQPRYNCLALHTVYHTTGRTSRAAFREWGTYVVAAGLASADRCIHRQHPRSPLHFQVILFSILWYACLSGFLSSCLIDNDGSHHNGPDGLGDMGNVIA